MEPIMHIPQIADTTRFWMLRTAKGAFFDEFLRDSYIAIGWNSVKKGTLENTHFGYEDALKEHIKTEYKDKRPGLSLGKIKRFCNELNEKDVVMIVGEGQLAFALVGRYYEDDSAGHTMEAEIKTHQIIAGSRGAVLPCPYLKRRKIELIKLIDDLSGLNPYLFKAMAVNMHSLSNLDPYATSILSACYDLYEYGGVVSLAFRVRQRNAINAYDLASFIANSARLVSNDAVKETTVKTSLNSPGDVILSVPSAVSSVTLILMCYLAIFGGKYKDIELNSLISFVKELSANKRENEKWQLEKEAIKLQNKNMLLQNKNMVQQTKNLAIQGKKLDQEARALRLRNDKTERLIDETFPEIYHASSHLDIELPENNVIDFAEMIRDVKQQNMEDPF